MEESCQHGPRGDDGNAAYTNDGTPHVDVTYIIYIGTPLLDEVGGHAVHLHAQQVLDLSGKDGDGYTRGETYHDGVGDVLDDGA